jgi:hypothetical protein
LEKGKTEDAATGTTDVEHILSSASQAAEKAGTPEKYESLIASLPAPDAVKYESGFSLFKHKIPMWIFLFAMAFLTVWSYRRNLSLIPLLGLISCLYMMAELSVWNWIYFTIWLCLGLLIYFGYSRKNSKLNMTRYE